MTARYPTLLLLLLTVFAAGNSFAATLTVTKATDTNDGICDEDCSLREAVFAAAPGDTIVFSALFTLPQTVTLTNGQINVDKSLTINGTGTGLTSVSGNNVGRIFYVSGGANVTMTGMKLRDGWVGATFGDAIGGAIYARDSSLNLSNMEFTNNTALYTPMHFGYGGAVYSYNCTLTANNLNIHRNFSAGDAVDVTKSTLDLRDSVITDNSAGGVSADTLNVENVIFVRNTGVAVSGQHVTLSNLTISGNGAGVLGGDSSSSLTILHSIISENGGMTTGGFTGGIINSGGAVIRETVIKNNTKFGSGGGIANTGNIYIIDSAITGNTASQHGGGIRTAVGQVFLTNSTVSGNVAGTFTQGFGGGIHNLVNFANPGGRVFLINSTVSNNRTSGNGGGLRQDEQGTATIRNTIIAGNISNFSNEADVSGTVVSEGVNLIGNTTGSTGWILDDLLDRDPMIAPLGNNGGNTFTHALLPGSPAINAGNNNLSLDPQTMLPLETDQRGFSRFIGGKSGSVDIGAYEANYGLGPVAFTGRIVTTSGRPLRNTRVTISDGSGEPRYAVTNHSGYYRFLNLSVAQTYTITATDKLYIFAAPLVVTADQDRDDLMLFGSL